MLSVVLGGAALLPRRRALPPQGRGQRGGVHRRIVLRVPKVWLAHLGLTKHGEHEIVSEMRLSPLHLLPLAVRQAEDD